MTKHLRDYSVAEIEEILTAGEDENGEPFDYFYSYKGYRGDVHPGTWNGFESWDEWAYFGDSEIVHPLIFPELGRVDVIDSDSGGEGANDLQVVFRITSLVDGSTRLFKKTGCWVSHDGSYWDGDFSEVEMKQKVVTVYE